MSTTPVDNLLDRLQNVHKSGPGWRADCPIGHRSHGTLSIRETSDATVLMCCHAGCGAAEVLAAIGLSLADLYPDRPMDDRRARTPAERHALREAIRLRAIRRLLPELAFETRVVLAGAGKLENDEPLTNADHARLAQAVALIASARECLR